MDDDDCVPEAFNDADIPFDPEREQRIARLHGGLHDLIEAAAYILCEGNRQGLARDEAFEIALMYANADLESLRSGRSANL